MGKELPQAVESILNEYPPAEVEVLRDMLIVCHRAGIKTGAEGGYNAGVRHGLWVAIGVATLVFAVLYFLV